MSYAGAIRSLACVSIIFGLVFLIISAWMVHTIWQSQSGLATISANSTSAFGSDYQDKLRNLSQEINQLWRLYEPFLFGFSVIAAVCSAIQILISTIIIFASSADLREFSATWKCTHLILLAAFMFCLLGPFSFEFMNSALPSFHRLGKNFEELTETSLEISPALMTWYYVLVVVNSLIIFTIASLACTFMHICADYNYDSTLTDIALEERRLSIEMSSYHH